MHMWEQDELREQILQLVAEFAQKKLEPDPFLPGQTMLQNSGKTLDAQDFVYLVDACLDGWLTSGRFTADFERLLARRVGMRGSLFVNSGSSANLLAVSALTSPTLGERALKPGDEVITCAVGFPTTINPIIQNGAVPVFVDAEVGTYNIRASAIEGAISTKTKAIVLAHTLGNPFDLDTVARLCAEHGLWLIEDTCDALGSTYGGKPVGSYGDLSTFSFYPAHHITTGEGGAVAYKSTRFKRVLESFRDWGRDCYCETGQDNTCKKRFSQQLGGLPFGYDHKFTYSHIGYNLKSGDVPAALGVSQLGKLDAFIDRRRKNFSRLYAQLQGSPALVLPRSLDKANPAWFGFPITLTGDSRQGRMEVLQRLSELRIGTRLLFAGNAIRQPAYQNQRFRVVGDLEEANQIMNHSFWVGVHPALGDEEVDFIATSILEATS